MEQKKKPILVLLLDEKEKETLLFGRRSSAGGRAEARSRAIYFQRKIGGNRTKYLSLTTRIAEKGAHDRNFGE